MTKTRQFCRKNSGYSRLMGLAVLCLALFSQGAWAARGPSKRFHVKYTCTVNKIPSDTRSLRVWLPHPVSGEYQRVSDITIEAPVPVKATRDAEYGNQFFYLEALCPKFRDLHIVMEFDVERYQALNSIDPHLAGELPKDLAPYQTYLQGSRYVMITEEVRNIAKRVVSGKSRYIDKVKALFDYVYDTMVYDKSVAGCGTGDVVRSCAVGRGGCADFHTLFVALCYAQQIPVKYITNFYLPYGKPAPSYRPASFHCNVEVLLPGYGWIPLDISHAKKGLGSKEFYFGSLDYYRIKIGEGRNINLSPLQHADRLPEIDGSPAVEVDGLHYENVDHECVYKER